MTREQLFEQEFQAKITPLLQEIPYKEPIFKCAPTISTNQILEQYSGIGLKGVSKSDYKDLSDGNLNCHNVRFLWELVMGITPSQLNVSPTDYYQILDEANTGVTTIQDIVLEKDVLDKIKFALIEKKMLEQKKPGKAVIPNGKR